MEAIKTVKFLFFLALISVNCILADEITVIKTKSGSVRGKLIQLPAARQDVYQFTGVPFAEPPTGERRFKKAVPKTPWADILDATKPSKYCIQTTLLPADNSSSSLLRDQLIPGAVESEDCLYLNIWAPRETLDPDPGNGKIDNSLPVYVFIHGGGFVAGSSMQDLLNGTLFSGVNNIVFVTIQYRLGSLGFAYFGKNDDAPGNVGLWDQLEALKWVSENIGSFGGNSSKITIGGESAGGASVSYHLLSPYSRKYFQGAIIESGTALGSWAVHNPDVAMTVTNLVVSQVPSGKCGSISNQSSVVDKIKCLRSLDASFFGKADLVPIAKGFGFGSVPVIDGDFVPKDPSQMLLAGNFYKVPMLIGANRDEGSLFLLISPELTKMVSAMCTPDPCSGCNDKLNDTSSYSKMVELAFYLISGIPLPSPIDQILLDAVQLHYWPTSHHGVPNGLEVIDAVVQAAGDYSMTCPTYNWANTASTFLQSIPLYAYHFSQRPAGTRLPEWMGVIHAQEMYYIFGEPLAPYAQDYGYSYDDKLLSKVMMEYWGNFIKYGDPNVRDEFASCDLNSTLPLAQSSCKMRQWPPYVGKDCKNQIVEIDTMTQVFNYGEPVACGLKTRECLFWSELFPKLTQLVFRNETL